MAIDISRLIQSAKEKVGQVAQRFDRDQSMPGFQLARGGLGNRLSQPFQSRQTEQGYKPSIQLRAAAGLQNFAENRLANLGRVNLMRPVERIQNPVARTLTSFPVGIAQGLLNAPLDVTAGAATLGREIGRGFDPTRTGNFQQGLAGGARIGEGLLNAYVPTPTRALAQNIGQQGLKYALKEGSKAGAKYGLAGGALVGLQDTSGGLANQLGQGAKQAAVGGVTGAAAGAILGGTGYGLTKVKQRTTAQRVAIEKAREDFYNQEIPQLLKQPSTERLAAIQRKADNFHRMHETNLYEAKGRFTPQDLTIINASRSGIQSDTARAEMLDIFRRKLKGADKLNPSDKFLIAELGYHADKSGIKPGFARIDLGTSKDTPKLSVEPTGGVKDIGKMSEKELDALIAQQEAGFKKNPIPQQKTVPPKVMNSLNPTGGLMVDYNPQSRMNMELGKNITTLDKTMKVSPDEMITIYRGAPKNQKGINPGDFVTTNPDLAKSYTGDGNVISLRVKAKDVLDDITEPLGDEYIYRPSKPLSVEPVGGKDLLSEARKYKSAEEFKRYNEAILSSAHPEEYIAKKSGLDLIPTGYKDEYKIYKDGKHIGSFTGGEEANPNGIRGVDSLIYKIKNIEIKPEYQGNKYGTNLIDAIKQYAELTRKPIIARDVLSSSARYWEKIGFVGPKVSDSAAKEIGKNVGNASWYPKQNLTDLWKQAQSSPLGGKVGGEVTSQVGQAPSSRIAGTPEVTPAAVVPSTLPPITGKAQSKSRVKPSSLTSESIIQPTTIGDIEKQIYGSETGVVAKGNNKSVGFIGDRLRRLEQGVSDIVSQGLQSENKYIRGMAGAAQDLMGGAGKSSEQIGARRQYRGGIDYATKIASDTQTKIYDLLGKDQKSLERVHSVLDPEISKIKVKESSLTPQEVEAINILRNTSNFINDTNYANGFITKEQWNKGRGGKYIARAYEEFDYPPEVADFVKNKDLKFDLNPFKKRTEITDWKKDNSIKDPAYLMGKRMQQTIFNSEVKKYTEWARQSGMISDTAKPGYVQLSDSRAYGEARGKWIRKDALEDIKGFFVNNDIGQKAYDVLNWYDRNPLRRSQKMLKTVFNPAVRLGNKTGNYVFAWLNGINPVTFAGNKRWADRAIKSNDPLYRQAVQSGLIGTDVTKADIAHMSAELVRNIEDPGVLDKAIKELTNSYSRVDDASKLAAYKTWIDRGIDPTEAANRTARGFQDYNMVGFLYDIGAKLPILGNPFVRFASESIRIAKNAAVDHPLRTIGTVAAWNLFTGVMSRLSGENEEDRKTRETRVGASHLPFTDISTNVQTPWGEVNVSRLLGFSTTFTPEDATLADLSKYSPTQNPLDKRNYGSDPLIGPIISLATDTDFRGKSIADPKQNKYTGSTLTEGERLANRAGFLARAYLPPTATDLYNVGAAVQGKENVYGQKKSPLQAVARVYPGVKIEKFGPEEAQKRRDQDAYFAGTKNESIQKQINVVKKQVLKGELDQTTADKRISGLQKGMTSVTPTSKGDTFNYIRESDGSMQSIDIGSVTSMPSTTGYDKVKKQEATYKIVDDVLKLPIDQQQEALKKLGVTPQQAQYYQVANSSVEAKSAFVGDVINNMINTGKTRNEVIQSLIDMRSELNGKQIASDSVLKELADQNIISQTDYKNLKQIKLVDGKIKRKVSGRKPKKIKLPKVKLIKTKVRRPKKIKVRRIKI